MALPTPTVLGDASGYIPTGTTRYVFAPAVADVAAPTAAEITAGTDLSKLVAAVEGFSGTGNVVDFPNAASRWTAKIPGMIDAADSSLTLNMDKGGDDAVDLFSDGSDGTDATNGFVVICYEGIATDGRCRVFPVQVTSCAVSTDLGAPTTLQVSFAIVQPPSQMITVPAA